MTNFIMPRQLPSPGLNPREPISDAASRARRASMATAQSFGELLSGVEAQGAPPVGSGDKHDDRQNSAALATTANADPSIQATAMAAPISSPLMFGLNIAARQMGMDASGQDAAQAGEANGAINQSGNHGHAASRPAPGKPRPDLRQGPRVVSMGATSALALSNVAQAAVSNGGGADGSAPTAKPSAPGAASMNRGASAASARTNRAPGSGAIASLSSGAGPVDAAARDHAAANEDDADRPSNPGGALDAVSENAGAAPRITPTIAMDAGSFGSSFARLMSNMWTNAGAAATPQAGAGANPSLSPTTPGQDATAAQKPLATSVTIELAPEAYGAMTVSMKFSSSGVSLHIAVTSQNALSLIRDSQQRLRDALESVGGAVHSLTTQVSPALAVSSSPRSATSGGESYSQSGSSGGGSDVFPRQNEHGDGRRGQGGTSNAPGATGRTGVEPSAPSRGGGDAGVYL